MGPCGLYRGTRKICTLVLPTNSARSASWALSSSRVYTFLPVCYILAECTARHEPGGYDSDTLHIVLEAFASDTLWELLVCGCMDGTGLRGHGRYPRCTRCSGGIWRFCDNLLHFSFSLPYYMQTCWTAPFLYPPSSHRDNVLLQFDLTATISSCHLTSCMISIWCCNTILSIPMYNIHLRATHTTTSSSRGVQIPIYLVSSTTDSLCRSTVVFNLY